MRLQFEVGIHTPLHGILLALHFTPLLVNDDLDCNVRDGKLRTVVDLDDKVVPSRDVSLCGQDPEFGRRKSAFDGCLGRSCFGRSPKRFPPVLSKHLAMSTCSGDPHRVGNSSPKA